MEFNINTGTLLICSAISACSSSSPTPTGYKIQATSSALAGDAVPISVVQTMSDGSTTALPAGANVTWSEPSTVTALDPGSSEDGPLPAPGQDPTATFLANPGRPDADLSNVLFILGDGTAGGTLTVTADISGVTPTAHATTSIAVSAAPDGDSARGATLYGANCAVCHGSTGHGSPADANGTSFTLESKSYDFPAPGLNSEDGNVAGDPDWNVALFAVASRADIDDAPSRCRPPCPLGSPRKARPTSFLRRKTSRTCSPSWRPNRNRLRAQKCSICLVLLPAELRARRWLACFVSSDASAVV